MYYVPPYILLPISKILFYSYGPSRYYLIEVKKLVELIISITLHRKSLVLLTALCDSIGFGVKSCYDLLNGVEFLLLCMRIEVQFVPFMHQRLLKTDFWIVMKSASEILYFSYCALLLRRVNWHVFVFILADFVEPLSQVFGMVLVHVICPVNAFCFCSKKSKHSE